MRLVIADAMFDEFPDLILGVVILHGIDNTQDRAEISGLLREAEASLPGAFGGTPVIDHPQIAPWREAYRKFGAKPKDYPSSIENIARRVLNGAKIGHINNLVSLYNTISLRHLLPVGGEDLDRISGDVRLTRAGDDEPAILLLGERQQPARNRSCGFGERDLHQHRTGGRRRRIGWARAAVDAQPRGVGSRIQKPQRARQPRLVVLLRDSDGHGIGSGFRLSAITARYSCR